MPAEALIVTLGDIFLQSRKRPVCTRRNASGGKTVGNNMQFLFIAFLNKGLYSAFPDRQSIRDEPLYSGKDAAGHPGTGGSRRHADNLNPFGEHPVFFLNMRLR